MQIFFDNTIKYLVISFLSVITIFIIANFINQENYPISDGTYFTDILFYIIPIIVIVLGLILSIVYKGSGYHGKAWILFTFFVLTWFVGDTTYDYDNEYDLTEFSTLTP